MDFDFAAYLAELDPQYVYRIDRITGGVVNVTVRATKVAVTLAADLSMSDSDKRLGTSDGHFEHDHGRFPDHKTLILKYAPSFIAGVGEDAPLSQDRQIVEAAALRLFLPTPSAGESPLAISDQAESLSLHQILVDTGVEVPTLLHHDPANHILIISDLGDLPDMSKIFIDLGGFTPGLSNGALKSPPFAPRLGHSLASSEIARFRIIGQKLGSFFARLHNPSTGHIVTNSDNIFPSLPEMKTAVHEHAIKPLLSQLLNFPSLLDEAEATVLFAAVEANFLRTTPLEEQCFVLGDSWTGAVLLDLSLNTSDVGVGVIDWEFSSSAGRGVDGDVSQFLAHLEALRVAALTREREMVTGHLSALEAIMEGFVQTYNDGQMRGFDDGMLRSAYLSHGAEIINIAFWKSWICEDSQCAPCRRATDSNAEPESQCNLVKKLVLRGLSFLRSAVAEDPRAMTANLRRGVTNPDSNDTQTTGLYDLFE